VLLLFSVAYAVVRAVRPIRPTAPTPMRAQHLLAAGLFVVVASYVIRVAVPLGEEAVQDLFVGQAPAWVTGFTIGAVGAERGWFDRIPPAMSRWLFRVAWAAAACVVVAVSVSVGALGADVEIFFGGGTWQSLLLAGCEGALVVVMSLWLLDVFRHHVNHQGRLMHAMSRAAFAAFVVHQVVAIGAVLATRYVTWPPELEYSAAATRAVVGRWITDRPRVTIHDTVSLAGQLTGCGRHGGCVCGR
jgi:glucan biosynthesis protein C